MANNFTTKKKMFEMFKWTLKRNTSISIIYSLLLFISLPLIQIYIHINNKVNKSFTLSVKNASPYLENFLTFAIVMIFAFIMSVVTFHYLHNKRQEDLFESLPMSKKSLFLARYFAVLVETTVPAVVIVTLGAILSGRLETFGAMMLLMVYMIIAIIANVTLVGFTSLVCGSTLYTVIIYLALNAALPVLVLIFGEAPSAFLDLYTTSNDITYIFAAVSPMLSIFFGITYEYSMLWHVIYWGIIILVSVVAILKFVSKRKSENAETQGISLKAEFVISFVLALAGALVGGLFAAVITDVDKVFLPNFFIGAIVGAIGVSVVLQLILHKGFSQIKIILASIVVAVAVSFGFMVVLQYDLMGYTSYVPEKSEVESFTVDGGDEIDDWGEYEITDKKVIAQVLKAHQDNVKRIKKLRKDKQGINYRYDIYTDDYDCQVVVNYKLKNGSSVKRSIYVKRELSDILNQYNAINVIKENKECEIDTFYEECWFSIYGNDVGTTHSNSKQAYSELRKAFLEDLKENGKVTEVTPLTFDLNIEPKRGNSYKLLCDERYQNVIEWAKKYGLDYIGKSPLEQIVNFNSKKNKSSKDKVKVTIKLPKLWIDGSDLYADVVTPNYDDETMYSGNSFMDKKCKCKRITDSEYEIELPMDEDTCDINKIILYKENNGVLLYSGALGVSMKKGDDSIAISLGKVKSQYELELKEDVDEFDAVYYNYKSSSK